MKRLRKVNSSEVLFHHRQPTSTSNTRNGCHPYSTGKFFKKNYIFVHNGVLQNEDELHDEHVKMGIKYVSERDEKDIYNDSEALMWDVALTLEGKQKEMKARGNIAFVMIERDKKGKPSKLYWGRNEGNPLHISKTKKRVTIASLAKNGVSIQPDRLYWYDYSSDRYGSRKFKIPMNKTYPLSRTYTNETYKYKPYDYDYEDYDDYYSKNYQTTLYEDTLYKKFYDNDYTQEEVKLFEDYMNEADFTSDTALSYMRFDLTTYYEQLLDYRKQEKRGELVNEDDLKMLVDDISVLEKVLSYLEVDTNKLFNNVFKGIAP